ncbi:hypothetical protein GCM10028805_02980 [Spirosoma harenae]
MTLEKLIRFLKNDPSYKWESSYSLYELSIISFNRLIQILRGLPLKFLLKSSNGVIFRGKNVTLKHLRSITSGRNLILDDNVNIDALSFNGIQLGNDVTIGKNSIIVCTGVIAQKGIGIKIGNGVGLNARVFLSGQGGIDIGDNVIIGPDVKIFSENHLFEKADVLIKKQGVKRIGVTIEEDCWIGSGSIILDGVTIQRGCVIAAGSVVTKSFSENLIVGGVPAKVIRNRI